MRAMLRSKNMWWVAGALLVGLGLATARAARFDLDFDPWDDQYYG